MMQNGVKITYCSYFILFLLANQIIMLSSRKQRDAHNTKINNTNQNAHLKSTLQKLFDIASDKRYETSTHTHTHTHTHTQTHTHKHTHTHT